MSGDGIVNIAVVGTGDGGLAPNGTAITPAGEPNVVYQVISPLAAILIRFADVYLTLMVGVLSAGMTTKLLPYSDFATLFIFSAKMSLAGAVVAGIKDVITILTKLKQRFPLLTGSI